MYFECYEDKAGEWRWRLLAGNGRIVGTSGEGYVRRAECLDSVWRLLRDLGVDRADWTSYGAADELAGNIEIRKRETSD